MKPTFSSQLCMIESKHFYSSYSLINFIRPVFILYHSKLEGEKFTRTQTHFEAVSLNTQRKFLLSNTAFPFFLKRLFWWVIVQIVIPTHWTFRESKPIDLGKFPLYILVRLIYWLQAQVDKEISRPCNQQLTAVRKMNNIPKLEQIVSQGVWKVSKTGCLL